MRSHKGFTLIELMITVAIIGILAAIALPSYTAYVTRGKIAEAVAGLSGMKVKMEQYFQDNRTYDGASLVPAVAAACGAAGTSVAPVPTGDQAKYFTFTCPTHTASQFTVTATGTGSMLGFIYTINESDVRATPATSWGVTSTSCWILKSDGSC